MQTKRPRLRVTRMRWMHEMFPYVLFGTTSFENTRRRLVLLRLRCKREECCKERGRRQGRRSARQQRLQEEKKEGRHQRRRGGRSQGEEETRPETRVKTPTGCEEARPKTSQENATPRVLLGRRQQLLGRRRSRRLDARWPTRRSREKRTSIRAQKRSIHR